jgi:hypothetical protein
MSNKIFDYITCGDSGNDIDLGVSCAPLSAGFTYMLHMQDTVYCCFAQMHAAWYAGTVDVASWAMLVLHASTWLAARRQWQ